MPLSKKKKLKTRDWLLVKLLQGATKAAVHKDKKKEADKYTARKAKKRDRRKEESE